MGIRAEIKVGSISHFSIHYQEAATPNKVKDQDPRQLRRFQKTNLSHNGLHRSRSIGTSASRLQEEPTSQSFKEKTTALPWSCRHVHPYCCLRFRTSHSPFCVTVHPARPQKPPHRLWRFDSALLALLPLFEDACHPQGKSPSRRGRPQRCPPWHRSHPAGGSSRFSQWQFRASSLRYVPYGWPRWPPFLLGGGEISGYFIFQLLHQKNDLGALKGSCRALSHKPAGSALVQIPSVGQFKAPWAQLVILSHRSLAFVRISIALTFIAGVQHIVGLPARGS